MSDFTKTRLFTKLQEIKTEISKELCNILDSQLPKIEQVLKSSGTSPTSFTLHDDDHSFRVAERIVQIVGEKNLDNLSEFDLFFLLMSSYLHDIGMSPKQEKVNNIYKILLGNELENISHEIVNSFQIWLDDNDYSLNLKDKVSINNYQSKLELDSIVSAYCRYKHNDWSAEWISNNLNNIAIKSYPNWLKDLINICQSHHFGLKELIEEKFDPILIQSKVVHRRFISMCLRVADVMENDPERTPDIIYKHREVIESSKIFWYKDHDIILEIDDDGNVSYYSRPKKAYIEKAVRETLGNIKQELILCETLVSKKPLNHISIRKTSDLNYSWIIKSNINEDILPFENSYEFIDGTFRPNIDKILELLAGEQLYGNRFNALRELIQNAFDAIKVQIAHRIINDGKKIKVWPNEYCNFYKITLKLIKREEKYWLLCSDNGVGMTKDIIKNCFLVSGKSKDRSLLELERRCKDIGLNIERTGQFGIGVLSYFMIADRIELRSKRAQDTGYHDLEGWNFKIDGFQDFGELIKEDTILQGTEISLRLIQDLFNEDKILSLEQNIFDYLKNIIIKPYCSIEFIGLTQTHNFSIGWNVNYKKYLEGTFFNFENSTKNNVENNALDYHDSIKQEKIKKNIERIEEYRTQFDKRQCFHIDEGMIPGYQIYYKIIIPYFNLEGGASLGYFHESENDIVPMGNSIGVFPESFSKYSWKGIEVYASNYQQGFIRQPGRSPKQQMYLHIDICDNSLSKQISVSRNQLIINKDFEDELYDFITFKYDEIMRKELKFHSGKYAFLNLLVSNSTSIEPKEYYWYIQKSTFLFEMRKINSFYYFDWPINYFDGNYDHSAMSQLGNQIAISKPLNNLANSEFFKMIPDFAFAKNMKRFFAKCKDVHEIQEIINKGKNYFKEFQRYSAKVNPFPAAFNDVCLAIQSDSNRTVIYFNSNNEIIKKIDANNFYVVLEKTRFKIDSDIKKEILSSLDFIFCFILNMVIESKYNNLRKNDSSFVREMHLKIDNLMGRNYILKLSNSTNIVYSIPINENENVSQTIFDNTWQKRIEEGEFELDGLIFKTFTE